MREQIGAEITNPDQVRARPHADNGSPRWNEATSGPGTGRQPGFHLPATGPIGWSYLVGLIVNRGDGHDRASTRLDPYDYGFHEDPYPYKLGCAMKPLYRQRRSELLGADPARRRAGISQRRGLSNKLGVSLDPISRTEAYRTMSFLAMD